MLDVLLDVQAIDPRFKDTRLDEPGFQQCGSKRVVLVPAGNHLRDDAVVWFEAQGVPRFGIGGPQQDEPFLPA